MTRPNIVRADTIDLQDHESPSAADHPKQPPANGLAPHQASEVNHIVEERHSEEQALADAWNIAENLNNEPGLISQVQTDHVHGHDANGHEHQEDEGAEGGETESDGEDDMMDRISSSPSIDDGGYTQYSSPPTTPRTAWPDRKSSLTPLSSPIAREAFNKSATSTLISSPCLHIPKPIPLSASALAQEDVFASDAQAVATPSPCVNALRTRELSYVTARQHDSQLSTTRHHRHHQSGRYSKGLENAEEAVDKHKTLLREMVEASTKHKRESLERPSPGRTGFIHTHDQRAYLSPIRRTAKSPNWRFSFARSRLSSSKSALDQSPSLSSIPSVDLESLLLPVNDPLLQPPSSPARSQDSWESVSDSEMDDDQQLINSEIDSRNHRAKNEHEVDYHCVDDDFDDFDDDDDDDDACDPFNNLEDRFIDSGWGGECLQDTEDIDFEFVYALHTFVATVEGQANATKGDTMVLLDDSNSYWWLVRVVKDNSIGYLPAEHIETPTERLARLNKHRNIDLSATMLSDNSEKPMNPLKKAMRRRNAKTVQFAAPTYVEASDNEYSSEDEDPIFTPHAAVVENEEPQQSEEPAVQVQAEPEEVKEPATEKRSSTSSNRASFDREQAATAAQALAEAGVTSDDDPQIAPKLIDKTEAAPLKSRKGTPRNTDSFLKDDSIETRKITLTPGLLREETGSLDSPVEQSRSSSFESLTKVSSPSDQSKKDGKDKKKESKKGGMFSGLFKSKKKEKKSKDGAGEPDSEKQSVELGRDSPKDSAMVSGKSSLDEKITAGVQAVQDEAPSQMQHPETQPSSILEARQDLPAESNSFIAELPGSEVAYEMATGHEDAIATTHLQVTQPEKQKDGPLSPITNILHKEAKPPKAKRSKQRVQLDDFDSPPEVASNPFDDPQDEDRLSDGPAEISTNTFMHGTESIHIPIVDDDDTGEDQEEERKDEDEEDEPASLTSSPSFIDQPAEPIETAHTPGEDSDPTPTGPRSPQPASDRTASATPIAQSLPPHTTVHSSTGAATPRASSVASTPTSLQAWNDGHLRTWLDDSSEVRDMLVIIHDKTGVTPVSSEHPLMSGLYAEPRKGVQDMMGQLDGLLGTYLQRKGVQF